MNPTLGSTPNTQFASGNTGYVDSGGTYTNATPNTINQYNPPGYTPSSTSVSPVINASQMFGTKLTIPNSSPSTAKDNLSATVNSQVAGATSATTPETNDTQSSIKSALATMIGADSTKGNYETTLQNQYDLPGKTQAVTDANSALTSAKAAQIQQINDIKNRSGGTVEGTTEALNNYKFKSDQDIANLSIIANTANGNLDAITKIISDKVAAQFDPIESNIKNLESFYQLNQNDLTEKEKITLQSQIDSQKTKSTALQTAYSSVLKNASTNGASQQVLSAIDKAAQDPNATEASIYAAAGKYGQDLTTQTDIEYKQAETAKINNDIKNAQDSGSSTVAIPNSVTGATENVPTLVAPYYNVSASGTPWIDGSTLQGTAAEKTQIIKAAQNAGYKIITNKNQAADLSNIQDVNNKLDTVSGIMSGIDQPSALSRDLYGLGLTYLATKAQSNPQQAAAGALQSIGLDVLKAISGVQGFRGNQTAIQQVQDHLPSIYDTADTVNTKIQYIKALVTDRENGLLGTKTDNGIISTIDQATLSSAAKSDATLVPLINQYGNQKHDDGTQWSPSDVLQYLRAIGKIK